MTVKIRDFYADWCGPCDRQHEIMGDVEEEWSEEDVVVEMIDIDDDQQKAQDYSVRSIPTIIISREVDDGEEEVAERFIGVTQENQISEVIEEALN